MSVCDHEWFVEGPGAAGAHHQSRDCPQRVRGCAHLEARGTDGAAAREIRVAISNSLGVDVPASSVRSYLQLNTPAMFERVTRGRYRLRVSTNV